MNNLKPCPFCGSKPAIKGKKIILVVCGCTARTYGKTKEEAIATWNRRTPYETNSNT